ncbi:MAG TPA: glycosyltransferase family 4 protein, partial [Chthoniobacteraceae bacterium]|nr:glycosyltransferase family 4 protein [Chthoniobacteraceae bacterium]
HVADRSRRAVAKRTLRAPMKLAFLSSYAHLALDPAERRVSGGAELQAALMARELATRGHDVLLIGGDDGQEEARVLQGVRARTGGKFHTGKVADTLRALPVVFRILAQERPDYTFIYGWTAWTFFLLWPRLRGTTRTGFVCMLDTEANGVFRRENPISGTLFEWGMHRADVRFAITEYQRECFREAGLASGLYRPLIMPRTTPLHGDKDIDLLWIARCRSIKRPHVFLDLASRLPQTRCVMVSPGEDRVLFRTVRDRANSLSNVVFHESVPYHEVQSLYDRARIFENTSTWEGFANSFIQAGQGEAAILSLSVDTDGLIERFKAGACAHNDVMRLAEEAARLLDDPGALRESQLGAARFVREWHDNNRNVDAFLAGLGAQ